MVSICIALIVDFILGDPYWFPHPVRLIGKYISMFQNLIKKMELKDMTLKFAGIVLTFTTVMLCFGVTYFILEISKSVSIYLYIVVNIFIMWTTIAAKCLASEGLKIYRILKQGNIVEARKQLSYIVGRDTENLNEKQIAKAVIETISENCSDGIIAPLFYLFIGGAPLAMAYKAVNTLDSMVGYKEGMFLNFGWASAKFDDIVNFIPARITGIMMVAAAFILRYDYKNSAIIFMKDRKKHSSPNSAHPEAAVAGALGIELGGTNYYFGKPVEKPTIGFNKEDLQVDYIKDSIKLMYGSYILSTAAFFVIKGVIISGISWW
ncbi:adenosylcobinamide-phosphate synthase CbiB [Clostridium folliculivorans]|uniref:Cobalamin biosynthesis protein CobD n=1 Tax=Clostridium folliculivorans TaxID=2886038 RepID=A0A9W5XZD3_9CLOT|nr:adenosylcobinamide-phosphate synthase CbiB [Clostridium folliculivorans]GKU23773.1 cobalamin biosynthesis protein CobD [Clostridium folliculivorans]GKU29889.1 cobalamin biosynthesis protein CobD [Clostridium folliculivorans]